MAIDVLKFNELKKQTNNYKSLSGYNANVATYNAISTCYNNSLTTLNSAACLKCGMAHPACAYYLGCAVVGSACFPSLSAPTGGFKVCDTSTNFNAGVCCQWTVPAGISQIRFQLWGAGAPSGGSSCCGGSMHGGTGAYASIIIPAVTGATYTICSGCAWWPGALYISAGTDITPYSGCASFVTGYGLQNFCAEGGEASMLAYQQKMTNCVAPSCCMLFATHAWCDVLAAVGSAAAWPCLCYNSFYCFHSSPGNTIYPKWQTAYVGTQRNDMMCYVTSCKTYYGASSFSNTYVYGVPGMFQAMCLDINNYGSMAAPSIYGLSAGVCDGYTISFTTGSCGGFCCSPVAGCLICGFGTAIPAMGGIATHSMSGTIICGSPGKMGMVCVQYQ